MYPQELEDRLREFEAAVGHSITEDELQRGTELVDVIIKGSRAADCLNGKPLIEVLSGIAGSVKNAPDKARAKKASQRLIRYVLDELRSGGQSIYDEVRDGLEKILGSELMP
jgi:hypothetical protein